MLCTLPIYKLYIIKLMRFLCYLAYWELIRGKTILKEYLFYIFSISYYMIINFFIIIYSFNVTENIWWFSIRNSTSGITFTQFNSRPFEFGNCPQYNSQYWCSPRMDTIDIFLCTRIQESNVLWPTKWFNQGTVSRQIEW